MLFLDDGNTGQLNSQRAVKDRNIRRVFSEVARVGSISRSGIARNLHLTPSTVSVLSDDMIAQRLIRETAFAETSNTGRKPMLITVNPEGMRIPVLSFKSTGIQYILLDNALNMVESDFEVFPESSEEQAENDYRVIRTEEIMTMIHRLLDHSGINQKWDLTPVICICMPGTFDWEKGTFSSTVTNQRGDAEFVNEIRKMLRNLPVLVGQTTRMRGYAEFVSGGNADPDTLYIEMGEGIGGSIFLNGECFIGATGLAGEIGHVTVNPAGPRCLCGNRGCLEKYVCRKAILDNVRAVKGVEMNWREVCAMYQADDPDIVPVIKQVARYLMIGISNMICALNVRKIILGGDAVDLGDRFIDELMDLKQINGYRKGLSKMSICCARLEKDCEATGIARLYQDRYHQFVR